MKKIINLLLRLSLCLNSYTQTSQLKSFDKEIFKEDFNSKNAPFHINSDKDNYMIIDDGDLFINRTNPSLAQAVFSKNSIETTAYRLKTAQLTNESLKNKFDKLEELSSKYEVIEKRNKFLENQYNIVSDQNNEQKLIASQFAESFQLEKQKNKQLHNEILSLYSEEEASENSKSVVYRVQLGIFDELIDVEGIENLTTIHTQAQQIIYIAGKFDNFSSARGYLLEMSKKGFKDAFIVKF